MARQPKLDEERPPHDALPGIPLPRETMQLVGHRGAEQTLLDAYRSARMPHGWIVAGERGIGKATLALRLARFVFAHPDPLSEAVREARDLSVAAEHPAARHVAIGVHPNLLHLQREWNPKGGKFRTEIAVDTIRRIQGFLGTTAGEGGWRVVIVDPADDMNRNAANAILKNLEEPPRQTIFLLLARSSGALLPTIRSRCRMLELAPLSAKDMDAVMTALDPGGGAGHDGLAARLAAGSPRRMLELGGSGGVELYRLMLAALERGDRAAQLRLSAAAAEPSGMEQVVELFEAYLTRRIRGTPEPSPEARPPPAPLVTWAELWEKATLSGREVETYNLDRRQFVLDLLESSAAALH